jgi:hypothetical protein
MTPVTRTLGNVVRSAAVNTVGERVPYDVVAGVEDLRTPMYGVVAKTIPSEGVPVRTIAFDWNHVHTIGLFGQPGGGKSYTLGTLIEAAILPVPGLTQLPAPLCCLMVHYSESEEYHPELQSMDGPNTDAGQVKALLSGYGVGPAAVQDMLILVPQRQLKRRQRQHPAQHYAPLRFHPAELRVPHWRILMGAVGEVSLYVQVLKMAILKHSHQLSVAILREEVDASRLSTDDKDKAHIRLDMIASLLSEEAGIGKHVRPGRLIIADIRDDGLEPEDAAAVIGVLSEVYANARSYASQDRSWSEILEHNYRADADGRMEDLIDGDKINKLLVLDECHKFMKFPRLVDIFELAIREMRHKACSLIYASQDPPSVPGPIKELSTHVVMHKMTAPRWIRDLQTVNACLESLHVGHLSTLRPGEGWLWATRCTEPAYKAAPVLCRFRPRVTQHGGATKTAVKGFETKGV